MGFSRIVSQRTAAARQTRKNNQKYFREYFTVSKIAAAILLAGAFAFPYFRLNGQSIKILVSSVIIFFILTAVATTVYYFRSYGKPKKELLCPQYSTGFQPLGLVCQFPVFLNFFLNGSK